MKLIPSSFYFSGMPVRDLLRKINYQTSDADLQIALGIVLGTNSKTLAAREKSHLTHSTPVDHQIRFALKDRVQRSLKRLALNVKDHIDPQDKLTLTLNQDDFISIEFFKHLPQVKNILMKDDGDSQELLSDEEKKVINGIRNREDDLDLVLKKSQERIYAGDYRSAYKILSAIAPSANKDEVHYMLGLCTNFFGRTDESEKHFRKLLNSSNPLNVVKASYVTSMLYLRMHPKEKQDLQIAENLLESAYRVLSLHPEIQDHTFHQVFNRNGFALCLFRRGRVEEALQMLEAGIERLNQDSSGAKNLHQSVLIYNAVQCLRILRRYSECESRCQELLALDPLFPEYSLELARVLLEQQKTDKAMKALIRAEQLDPFIPETQALLGFANIQNNFYEKAARHYRQAWQLNPLELQWALDLGYCLSETENWIELQKLLLEIPKSKLLPSQQSAWQALHQEVFP